MTITSQFDGVCKACGCPYLKGAEISWTRGIGGRHITTLQCEEAKRARYAANAARAASGPRLDIKPIAEFLRNAQKRGLKRPKLRVLALDGQTEMALALTVNGVAPGSISVVEGSKFLGCIRPNDAMTNELKTHLAIQRHLLTVAEDPAKAAKTYAALKGICSFCGLPLTDAGSVEVGYGPVCAKHWGLPHHPKGTPTLSPVPGGAPVQQRMFGGHV